MLQERMKQIITVTDKVISLEKWLYGKQIIVLVF